MSRYHFERISRKSLPAVYPASLIESRRYQSDLVDLQIAYRYIAFQGRDEFASLAIVL